MSYLDILHQYWGYPEFRGIQKEIIESIGSGKDTLGLMPTGGGKSLTFQVPALAQEGVCLVITPLIALMKDQVDHLRRQGITAAAIYSGMRHDDIITTLENCTFGGIKLLYISPERIGSDIFKAKLRHIKVSFITVDEAHCISQWGYDFRPSYLQIADIRKLVPDAPILALTATATPEVVDDIQDRLGFKEKNVFRMSFERKNLAYSPSSLEAYFQEAGRAGRDGNKAYAVLLYNGNDNRTLQKRIEDTFPPKDYIQTVYEHLAYFYQIGVGSGYGCIFEFPIDKFCNTFKHFPIRVNAALTILQRAGYIDYEQNPDTKARVRFLLNRDDLYRLDSLTDKENDIVTALLRNYGGLFSDSGYIDESYIAQEARLDRNQTYMVLVNLSKKRIINFIPRKNTPLISYSQDRIDGIDVILNKSVYEDRKEQFIKRINSVINYAQNEHVCRSRQLLSYFGETKSKDCEQCDVCLSHTKKEDADEKELIREQLLTFLSDGQKHPITEIRQLNDDWDLVQQVMREMVLEEEILMDGSFLLLP